MRKLTGWLCAAAALLVAGTGSARAAEASKEGIEFFEKNIRPVLAENCYKCHSAEAIENKKLKGKLRVDNMASLLKGGESGKPAIAPGDPEKSALIKGLRYEYTGDDETLNMPPKSKKDGTGGKLKDEVIKNFEKWVKMGAPVPKDFEKPKEKADASQPGTSSPAGAAAATAVTAVDPKAHWAFGQPKLSPVPAVQNGDWARSEIDRFVLAKLEAKGLRPAAQLDRRALIRRATFDLIGLPPTPEEVEAFVNDKSPEVQAFEKVVDRLLNDPRYGERWARHWLDVARYADTKGYVFQEERRYPYAYTYRDYVIRAFNENKPYDQFLIEQIAADQLDLKTDKTPLAAMGFLTLGRRFLNNVNDIIDDRLDVVCRGTMALTVGCARCHDHKFDPIPTKDYYSLHGVFASSMEPKDLPLIGGSTGSPAFEAELKKRQAAAEEYLTTRSTEILAQIRSPKGVADYLMGVASRAEGSDGQASANDLSRYMLGRWQTFLAQSAQREDAVFAAWRAYATIPAAEFEKKSAEVTERLSKADGKKPANPLVVAAMVGAAVPPKSLRDVAERYGALLAKYDRLQTLADANEESLRLVLRGPESPVMVPQAELGRLFKRDSQDKLRQLQNKVQEWQATSPDAPARAMVLMDGPNPHDSNVMKRGNPGNPGDVAKRQFLACISTGDRKPFTQGSGRLELAKAIASKDNPLTARVFVNRVWGWHFGQPIVTTPSDFGVRSDYPSHPELLDWMAVTFMNDGWSVKKLQKRILMSAAYQQASDVENATARAADPENRLLWRQNRLRLDFEEVRDALLYVSGQLSPTLYGKPVSIADANETRRTIYGFVDRQNLPSMYRSFDFASPDMHSPQRSATTVPQQALFFLNSPFSQRQAKQLLERTDVKGQTDIAGKVTRMYQVLYGRNPSSDEVALARTFIDSETSTTSESPAAVGAKPIWLYGYGKVDEKSRKVASFTVLPYKGRNGWRGGQKSPDPALGFVMLSANGGHPGDGNHAAIRRWTAPAAGTVDIAGTLAHAENNGDGIRGRIVSARAGILGEWSVRNGKAETSVKAVAVEAGETIDFVVESGATDTSDSFTWSPTLKLAGPKVAGGSQQFDAAKDFSTGSNEPPAMAEKLSPWVKYAQVLLSSNEFVFVD